MLASFGKVSRLPIGRTGLGPLDGRVCFRRNRSSLPLEGSPSDERESPSSWGELWFDGRKIGLFSEWGLICWMDRDSLPRRRLSPWLVDRKSNSSPVRKVI